VEDQHETEEEELDDEEVSSSPAKKGQKGLTGQLSAELLKNPGVMAALQGKLNAMAGGSSGYIQVTHTGPIPASHYSANDECH